MHEVLSVFHVENAKFAVGISTLTVVVLEITLFPVSTDTLPFPVSNVVSVAGKQLLRACRGRKVYIYICR